MSADAARKSACATLLAAGVDRGAHDFLRRCAELVEVLAEPSV